jgi:hypothetical protein
LLLFWSIVFWPTIVPITIAASTNASHPKIAVFLCERSSYPRAPRDF